MSGSVRVIESRIGVASLEFRSVILTRDGEGVIHVAAAYARLRDDGSYYGDYGGGQIVAVPVTPEDAIALEHIWQQSITAALARERGIESG